ncbi:MAG: hypothetical protein VCB43_06590 [Myxococcota bacterium]
MTSITTKLRLTSLLVAFAFVAGLAATASASVHPLSGNARYQVGDGLPIPIGFTPVPVGKVLPVPGAVISQPAGPDPRALVFAGGELKHAVAPFVIPVFNLNPAVFQVLTSLGLTVPLGVESLVAGGRTGASTVHYCQGQTVTPTGDPNCLNAGAGPGVNGLMIYTKTAAQFGGAMYGRLFGGADVALYGGGDVPPCTGVNCKIAMALASPNSTGTGGIGNAFGGSGMSPGAAPPSGLLTGMVTAAGRVTTATPTPLLLSGLANPASGGGGPWTTGMLTVSVTAALAGAEIFVLTGGDSRVSGVGAISLVAGSVSNRGISGPNANRGWLNLTIGSPLGALPSISGPGIAALVGLMSLAGGYVMRQRNRK